jgi:hypothetical protein
MTDSGEFMYFGGDHPSLSATCPGKKRPPKATFLPCWSLIGNIILPEKMEERPSLEEKSPEEARNSFEYPFSERNVLSQ